jgi:hypothetical protein
MPQSKTWQERFDDEIQYKIGCGYRDCGLTGEVEEIKAFIAQVEKEAHDQGRREVKGEILGKMKNEKYLTNQKFFIEMINSI